jgi:glycosidase
MNWYEKAVVYHIYPLGYCGCEKINTHGNNYSDGESPILKVKEQIPELKRLGFNTVFFGPVFESVSHGYDTIDYLKVDSRLGTNKDFSDVCNTLHENGINVIVDGVFNHVGRDFAQFADVRKNKFGSKYKDWFQIRDGNSNYNDGFFYEGWEGHYELVKLNLYNGEVKNYLKGAVSEWIKEFGIDGVRLDVAYCLDLNFLKELHSHCKGIRSDFWLMGETLNGDYNKWMNAEMLDSVTNYECYKGLYSSFNSLNMFEIAYSLKRQFGGDQWCLYRGKKLYCFVDNHDVSRVATILTNKKHLTGIYTMLFTMPGIPGVYYGSEYGVEGDKKNGDDALRPKFELNNFAGKLQDELPLTIAKLSRAKETFKPLYDGEYREVVLRNKEFAFARVSGSETAYTLINAGDEDFAFSLNAGGNYTDVISGAKFDISKPVTVAGCKSMLLVQGDVSFDDTVKTVKPVSVQVEIPVSVQVEIPAAVSEPVKAEPVIKQDNSAKVNDIIEKAKAELRKVLDDAIRELDKLK